jgi:glycine cleavage system aminomethyltransferase T
MTEAPGSSSTGSATSTKLRKKARELINALQEEAAHHGGLRTRKSLRLENELRLELSKAS